ncbi:MAG: CDP-alcohol phosphatidyltransferase family protein [Phycisphaerae bacterium]
MSINLANQITLFRLALAIGFFAVLSTASADALVRERALLVWTFWMFLVAALADILDGYVARALGQETTFGRIVDPVVDKVLVCGAFIFFASSLFADPATGVNRTGVAPWMVVLILVRELLVSAIRSHVESTGADFRAVWVGKLKMLVQSTTIGVILGRLAWFPSIAWLETAALALLWLTVTVTFVSMLAYLGRAAVFLRASAPRPPPSSTVPPSDSRPARLAGHAPDPAGG